MAYRPLGKSALLEEPVISQIGNKYQKTSAQILLRWLYQKEIPFVVKTSSEQNLQENFSILDFALEDSDMSTLDSLDRGKRFCNQPWADFEYK